MTPLSDTLRSLVDTFPWPAYGLHAFWMGVDEYKPWKWGRVRAARAAAGLARSRPRNSRSVVFVSDSPRMREAKLARGLREAGMEVVLLHRRTPGFDPTEFFTRSHRYRDSWEALQLASEYSPLAYHVFACWSYQTALTFLRHRPGKIVLDVADVLGGMITGGYLRKHFPGRLEQERFCLEHADALCCRDLQIQYLRRRLGYRIPGRTIFFPDLSVARPASESVPRAPEGEIHVVMIGVIGLERYHPYWKDQHYVKLAEAIVRDGVHLHLYGTAQMQRGGYETTYADYLGLARRYPTFHLHRPVPLPQLLREMKGYTFGMHVAGIKLNFEYDDTCAHRRACYDYAVTNRNFDYLLAGLPIVLHNGRFPTWVMKRLGIAHTPDPQFLASPREWLQRRLPTEDERNKLAGAAEKIDLRRQIPRLLAFYRSLA